MIIDLTMPIDERTPAFPGDPAFETKQIATIENNGWNVKRLCLNSHFSTHVDVPLHMIENGKTLSDYPLEKFIGEAVVLDVRGQSEIVADLSEVRKGDIVFFLTGHSKKAYDRDYFRNPPLISERTAQELVDKEINIVGIDSFTPDKIPCAVHKMFMRADILIVENLINLEKLAGRRFWCCIMPLHIRNGDGAPCRVAAMVDEALLVSH